MIKRCFLVPFFPYAMSKKTDNDTEKIHETFTEEQLSEIKEAFNLFPQDRECIRADSVETLLRALGHNPSPEEMQKIFKHLHIYSQSKVSFNMFLSVIAMLFSSCSEESIRQAFRMFDKVLTTLYIYSSICYGIFQFLR